MQLQNFFRPELQRARKFLPRGRLGEGKPNREQHPTASVLMWARSLQESGTKVVSCWGAPANCSSRLSAEHRERYQPAARRWHCQRKARGAGGGGSREQAAAPRAAAAPDTERQRQLQPHSDSDLSSVLSLGNIRQTLIRLEDTIIFGLIERAQFALNAAVYRPDAIPVPGFRPDGTRYSLLEFLLRDIEQVHGRIRRYTSPDEHPYYPNEVPPLVLPPITYSQVPARGWCCCCGGQAAQPSSMGTCCKGALWERKVRSHRGVFPPRASPMHPPRPLAHSPAPLPTPAQVLAPGSESININDRIMEMYLDHLLPEITAPGDDGNYGSSAMNDVTVLQVGGLVSSAAAGCEASAAGGAIAEFSVGRPCASTAARFGAFGV